MLSRAFTALHYFRKEKFPYGIHKLFLTTKSKMVMMIPAPGTYYGRERYFNQIRIEPKVNYGFTVRKVNLCESFIH